MERVSLASSTIPLDCFELEEKLYPILGRFFVGFARMELNLSLRVGGDGTFNTKLERLLQSASETNSEETFCKILAWYMAADSMREMRNRLAHGRWGYLAHLQQVAHVAGYPPDLQDERRFSFDELNAIVRDVQLLSNELGRIFD